MTEPSIPEKGEILPSGEQDGLVIAIDFGTTFSGAAYAFKRNKDNIEVISAWPNSGNNTKDKVPSEILYDTASIRSGKRKLQWGYDLNTQSQSNIEPIRWFKLMLHNSDPLSAFARDGIYGRGIKNSGLECQNSSGGGLSWSLITSIIPTSWKFSTQTTPVPSSLAPTSTFHQQTRLTAELNERLTNKTPMGRAYAQLTELGVSPVEAVTDYLQCLREYIVSVIEARFPPGVIRRMRTEYVLTVPAVWSDTAKAFTKIAATNAGFGQFGADFNLVGEPEAAAAHALKVIGTAGLKEGDTFVVCDAGGGSVDLVSYRIELLEPLAVSEVIAGTGGLCGSVFLNEKFEEHIRKRLGNDTIDNMNSLAKHEMIQQWEGRVKFGFADAEEKKAYAVCIPGLSNDKEKGLEGGFLRLTRDDVKSIFEPVISEIIALIAEQVSNVKKKGVSVKAILLVGGFGSSEYLRKRLCEQEFCGGKVRVMQPQNAWTSIIRGALIRGLDGSFVKSRIARKNYGVEVEIAYQPGEGLEKYKRWCEYEEAWKAHSQIRWIADKGMVIEDQNIFSIKVYYVIGVNLPWNKRVNCQLLACSMDKGPSWYDKENIFPVCEVEADLAPIPWNEVPQKVNSKGIKYWKLEFYLKMKIINGLLTFSWVHDEKDYGKVEAKFY
ncbi:hypothetical protein RUND412_008466 [Rhizina undulata]